MRDLSPPRLRARRRRLAIAALAPLVLALSGCDANKWWRFGYPEPVTDQADRMLALWRGNIIASGAIGGFVIVLIVFSALWFRKRSDELPRQVRYNIPIEVLYTVIPLVIVGVLFVFTARDQVYVDKLSKNPDVTVNVVGFQWSWQFTYAQVQGQDNGLTITGRSGQFPQLVLPVGQKVRFVETSPDVIHSFWVIPFVFKRDVIPGHTNEFEVTINKEGTFSGKCAEYCGMDHARMLFTVKAVSPEEFQRFLTDARAQAEAGTNSSFTTVAPATSGSAQ